ncbi:MAG: FadR/GntR family transcriptional regulator [Bacteroidia bacterium]
MLTKINKTTTESAVNNVIQQIRTLIASGELKPGDTLPPERKLAEALDVSRQIIRDSIKKLEFYGLVKTYPQSGTKIRGKGLIALEGLIVDILDIEEADFDSIIEFRNLLEIKSAGLAAEKRTENQIELIKKAQLAYEDKIQMGETGSTEDLNFHLQIAEISGNSVLKLMMRVIAPDILKNSNWRNRNSQKDQNDIIDEHKEIVNQIISKDPKGSKNAMRKHLRGA